MNDIECDGGRTMVEVRDGFKNEAVGVECLWPTDFTGRVPVRVQDDLGIDEIPGGDSLIQSFAKSRGSCHVCRLLERISFVIGRIYTTWQAHTFRVKPNREPKRMPVVWFGRVLWEIIWA